MNNTLKNLYSQKEEQMKALEGLYNTVKLRSDGRATKEETERANAIESELEIINRSIDFQRKLAENQLAKDAEAAVRISSNTIDEINTDYFRTATGTELPVFNRDNKMTVRSWYEKKNDYDDSLKGMTLGRIARIHQTGPKNELEERALAEGTPSAGGYTVPSIISAGFIDMLRPKSTVLRAGANVISFDGTNSYNMAKLTTGMTVEWLGENAEQTPADMVFGNVQFAPKTLRAMVLLSNELLQDSLNIEQIINAEAARAFATELDRVCLVGSGTGAEPKGIANYTSAPFIWNGANGETPSSYDEILSLIYELQAGNANVDGTSAAIMHPRTLAAYNLLKDTVNDQPLQRPNYIKDMPFYQTTSVPITDTYGNSSVASKLFIGDWSQLYIGVRNQVTIQPLNQRYAEFNQTGFLITMRADVKPLHEQSFGYIKGILGATVLT